MGLHCAISILLLTGCAGQQAFNDAQEFSAKNNVEAALGKYREALKAEPNNAEYRLAYDRAREQFVRTFLDKANQYLIREQRADAERYYRRVLVIEPENDRALSGLRNLLREVRHDELIKSAAADLVQKKVDSAKAKLTTVLHESPNNEKAIGMLRSIDQHSNDKTRFDATLASIYQRPISIEFKDAYLKQVFDVIAQASGMNIILDKDIKLDQKTSIFLKNSTVEAAIYYMLIVNQLDQVVLDANTLLIYPANAGKQKDYQHLVVKSFMLANGSAKTIAETIKTIIKTKDIVVDEKLNMIIMRDSPEAIALAEKLVATQDLAEPEVMLEVEILEVTRERLLDLGVDLPSSLSLSPIPRDKFNLTLTDFSKGNRSRDSVAVSGAPVLSYADRTLPLNLTIKANASDTDTKTLANPRIRVLNRETAKILIGNRVPSVSSTTVNGGSTESITYIDVGLKLEVQPTIYLDNEIGIRVGLEVSNAVPNKDTKNGNLTYTIGTRNANTVLRLKDGENQVLAGLINDDDKLTASKFPGLGDFPILGRLFGSKSSDIKKTEILLSITPHLIRNVRRPDAAIQEFASGTESSLRRRPDLSARQRDAAPAVGSALSIPAPVVASPSDTTPAPQENAALLTTAPVVSAPVPVMTNLVLPLKSDEPILPNAPEPIETPAALSSSKLSSRCTVQNVLALSCE